MKVGLCAGAQRGAVSHMSQDREKMVHAQLEKRGVQHAGVLRAMRATPRERFVPGALAPDAYTDDPLPIGKGQTISQPYMVAAMTELLDPKPGQRVLEVGTGCGYQTAILAQLAAHVYSIEYVEMLAVNARALLAELGFTNVTVVHGNGWLGWPDVEQIPFDRIMVTAAPPEIPPALIEQLSPGGRLVVPVGEEWQDLVVVDKDSGGRVQTRTVFPVAFVPMVGKPR